jgi:hypothetical protein
MFKILMYYVPCRLSVLRCLADPDSPPPTVDAFLRFPTVGFWTLLVEPEPFRRLRREAGDGVTILSGLWKPSSPLSSDSAFFFVTTISLYFR